MGRERAERATDEIMERDAPTRHPADNLAEAVLCMERHDVGFLPVVDHASRLVGVLTRADVCRAAWERCLPLRELTVFEAMTEEVQSCRPADPPEVAEALLRAHGLRRLPVTDAAGVLRGVVSLDALLESRAREDRALRGAAEPRVHETTTGTIPFVPKAHRMASDR